MQEYWLLLDVQPEPWRVPPFNCARGRGGSMFPRAGQDAQLATFKNAAREQAINNLQALYPELSVENGDFLFKDRTRLTVYVWRNIDTYEITRSPRERKAGETQETGEYLKTHAKTQEADATNLLKAIEDALHGIFYNNDKQNRAVECEIVHQDELTKSGLLIHIEPYSARIPPITVENALSSLGLAF